MNRRIAMSLCVISVSALLTACQKPADQQSGPDASSSPSTAESVNNAVKKVLEPKPLVVPADTVIAVVLDQTISSKTSKSGTSSQRPSKARSKSTVKLPFPKTPALRAS